MNPALWSYDNWNEKENPLMILIDKTARLLKKINGGSCLKKWLITLLNMKDSNNNDENKSQNHNDKPART